MFYIHHFSQIRLPKFNTTTQTPNAIFEYFIDKKYPKAVEFFGITGTGVLYVQKSLLEWSNITS